MHTYISKTRRNNNSIKCDAIKLNIYMYVKIISTTKFHYRLRSNKTLIDFYGTILCQQKSS